MWKHTNYVCVHVEKKMNEMKSNGMEKQMEVFRSGFVLSGLEYLYNPSYHVHYKILTFLVI